MLVYLKMCGVKNARANEENIDEIERIRWLPIKSIAPDTDQPRKFFNEAEIDKLAASIEKFELLQPILVRPFEGSAYSYMIVLGEMRFRAHIKLGRRTIKAIVKVLTRDEAHDLQLVENVQRRDLTDIELALEFAHLKRDLFVQEKIYEVLTQQYELAKLSIEGEEPIFQILELAEVPDKKSAPRRSIICMVTVVVVFFLSIIAVFILIVVVFAVVFANEMIAAS